jgi:FkbM family methyltransferase
MDRVTTFCRLRSALAPAIRPVLTYVPPVRWLALKLLARRQPAEVTIDGLAFEVHPADFGVTFEIASTGEYEPITRGACVASLEAGATFVDIGAHVGLFAVPAAKAVGVEGRVVCFEPDPDNRRLLERNLARHELSNVEVVGAAVADHAGSITLKRSSFNTGDHRIDPGKSARGVEVPMVSLDAWIEEHGIEPDVIKMDVQGAEPLVIAGMQDLLEGNRPLHIFLEFAPAMLRSANTDPRALLQRLTACGFVMRIIDERHAGSIEADVEAVMSACPARSYINLHCVRGDR